MPLPRHHNTTVFIQMDSISGQETTTGNAEAKQQSRKTDC